MIHVQGGTFTMGATPEQGSEAENNEYPSHSVTLSDYYIAETEVTQELWEAVMGSNPSWFKGSNLPVECVDWLDDCQEFIAKLNQLTGKNFRLPTEAEWEYAARGGNKSSGYKYAGSNDLDEVAWYWQNSGDDWLDDDWNLDKIEANKNNCKTHPVKSKKPNELGLYDMSGNVCEWCQDWYDTYSNNSQTNPKGPSGGYFRVIRGGCWGNDERGCRVSDRLKSASIDRFFGLGLRLTLSDNQME